MLVDHCVDLLDVDAAGVLLSDQRGGIGTLTPEEAFTALCGRTHHHLSDLARQFIDAPPTSRPSPPAALPEAVHRVLAAPRRGRVSGVG